jgi:hypothetical protein
MKKREHSRIVVTMKWVRNIENMYILQMDGFHTIILIQNVKMSALFSLFIIQRFSWDHRQCLVHTIAKVQKARNEKKGRDFCTYISNFLITNFNMACVCIFLFSCNPEVTNDMGKKKILSYVHVYQFHITY